MTCIDMNTENVNFDFIIVGQGLAGTLLGYELILAGKTVFYIDSPFYPRASEVAAGLVNPVVFKRMTKSWRLDELYPSMPETYAGLEHMLGETFFYPLKIRKVFGEGDALLWERKYFENNLEDYISRSTDREEELLLNMPYGCGWVEKGARIDLKRMLLLFRQWLTEKHLLLCENLEYDLLRFEDHAVQYKKIGAGKIVFCEGAHGRQNPFFKEVIYKPVKGEILDLTIEGYHEKSVLSKSFFLLPVGGGRYRLGATYDWGHLDSVPTPEGRNVLTGQLGQVLKAGFSVVGHQAGVRPVTHDRRPVAGLHPVLPNVGILNGLGAKGCLNGPFVARVFAGYLLDRVGQLPAEISISRYFSPVR